MSADRSFFGVLTPLFSPSMQTTDALYFNYCLFSAHAFHRCSLSICKQTFPHPASQTEHFHIDFYRPNSESIQWDVLFSVGALVIIMKLPRDAIHIPGELNGNYSISISAAQWDRYACISQNYSNFNANMFQPQKYVEPAMEHQRVTAAIGHDYDFII